MELCVPGKWIIMIRIYGDLGWIWLGERVMEKEGPLYYKVLQAWNIPERNQK